MDGKRKLFNKIREENIKSLALVSYLCNLQAADSQYNLAEQIKVPAKCIPQLLESQKGSFEHTVVI